MAAHPSLWHLKRHLILIMGRIGKHDTQSDTQDGTQGGTLGVPQDKELDDWIKKQIRNNPQISTEDLVE